MRDERTLTRMRERNCQRLSSSCRKPVACSEVMAEPTPRLPTSRSDSRCTTLATLTSGSWTQHTTVRRGRQRGAARKRLVTSRHFNRWRWESARFSQPSVWPQRSLIDCILGSWEDIMKIYPHERRDKGVTSAVTPLIGIQR